MKIRKLTAAGGLLLMSGVVTAAGMFGGADDVAYAGKLWQAMERAGYIGRDGLMSTPYTGVHPHGAILDTIEGKLSLDGQRDTLIVKRNYGGEGVNKQAVANNPEKWLQAVTVMYKRSGYDPETGDWFWVKFSPAGEVLKNPKGAALAGRVGKGGDAGCIACHKSAPGGDMVFNHDRY